MARNVTVEVNVSAAIEENLRRRLLAFENDNTRLRCALEFIKFSCPPGHRLRGVAERALSVDCEAS